MISLKGEEGDLLLFGANYLSTVNESLGALRVEIARRKGLIEKGPKWAFTWVTDFPMFGKDEKGRLYSMNYPFTAPREEKLSVGYRSNEGDSSSL